VFTFGLFTTSSPFPANFCCPSFLPPLNFSFEDLPTDFNLSFVEANEFTLSGGVILSADGGFDSPP